MKKITLTRTQLALIALNAFAIGTIVGQMVVPFYL